MPGDRDGYDRAANESAARALMQAGNIVGAEARLRNMLAHSGDDARAMALLAHCRLMAGARKQGLEIARSAAVLSPDDPLVRSTLSWALQLAGKGKKAKQEAEDLAEDILADDPEDSHALYETAMARFNNEDPWAARQLFDDAERFASTATELVNVAWLRLQEWNYDSAAALAQRAMLLDPNDALIFRILAECALAKKEPEEGYDLALEALRLGPGDKHTLLLLTRARARKKRWLRPFLKGVDWIVEMNRTGLVIVPVLMLALGFILKISIDYDLERIAYGRAPVIVLSVIVALALVYALVSYWTALSARWRIRRDLRRLSLPNF